MGSYLNPGNKGFQESLNSAIYIDKTGFIEKMNTVLNTRQKFICVSRPRRFGKSMTADMLSAYYGRSEDSADLFDDLMISRTETYRKYLNQYDVVKINMQDFLSAANEMDEMLRLLQKRVLADLKYAYPEYVDGDNLSFAMQDIFAYTCRPFVILIDEWDCLFREYQEDKDSQK